jgi:hypothetical protein
MPAEPTQDEDRLALAKAAGISHRRAMRARVFSSSEGRPEPMTQAEVRAATEAILAMIANGGQCGVWGCNLSAVERLEHINTRCGGTGFLDVCVSHLIDHVWEHFAA